MTRGSKLLAWHMAYMSFAVSVLAILKGFPDVAIAVMSSGFIAAAGLYASKQWSDAKNLKTTNKE